MWKIFVGAFAGLILLGLVASNEYTVVKSIEIKAPIAKIHPMVENLDKWKLWSVWRDGENGLKITNTNVLVGIGATQNWENGSQKGRLTITQSNPESGIEYVISFDDSSKKTISTLRYESISTDLTRVTWETHGKNETLIIGSLIAIIAKNKTATLYEGALLNLKKQLEGQI